MAELGEEKVYCNKCLQETRHELIAERQLIDPEYDELGQPIFDWTTTYTMLQCMGCGSVTLRKLENYPEPDLYQETFYPPQVARLSHRGSMIFPMILHPSSKRYMEHFMLIAENWH